jgi:uncharacterized protein YdcH (DUF465 family)
MKLSELHSHIKSLGFEKVYEDQNYVNDAITRALMEINSSVKAVIGRYDFTADQYHSYDLPTLTDRFDQVDRIVERTDEGTKTFTDYEIEQGRILVMNKSGDFTVFYKERVLPVTTDTDQDSEIQCEYTVEPLVHLLTAYYVWLDDDATKSAMYYNQYEQLKKEILSEQAKPKARIVGGFKCR